MASRIIYNKRLNNRGQTSVEYILLIVVAVSFGLTFVKKMEKYLINNPNGLISKPLNGFKEKLSKDPTGRYRVYPIGPIAQ